MSVKRLYVGNLSDRVRERELEDLFGKYGRNKVDLKQGFGFVEFEDSRDAEDAMRDLDGYRLDDQKIRVEPSRGPRSRDDRYGRERGRAPQRSEYRVIVDGLSETTSWQDLKDHMRRAGDVLFADVVKDRDNRSKVCIRTKHHTNLLAQALSNCYFVLISLNNN
eukprot:GEZU01033665.1.p1 GENE.GEZU01033665.1~~GEZU01033665.1.p1  ORF type:complete len:171 (+),score=30.18 GEZU01033665.1:22-513(+)